MLSERIETWKNHTGDKRELYGHKYKCEKQYKELHPFLKEVDSVALQSSRRDLETAYQNFFRRIRKKDKKAGFPKFKKKHAKNSYRVQNTNGNVKIDFEKRKIKIPKMTWISFRDDRVVNGVLKQVTISMSKTGKFFASILFETEETEKPLIQKSNELRIKGLDMSLTNFFVDEQGNSPQYV